MATPIGNLEDLTFRALRTLREADVIAAEDTRRTGKLLAHYELSKPLVSLHEHNEHREAPSLVARLRAGEQVALVSDAGTPGISDPGAELVRLAREAQIRVVPIPGPSAITAALSVTGLSESQFVFLGFPPPSGAARQRWLQDVGVDRRAVVFFEAPHRIKRTVSELATYCGERPIFVFRELSKIHEELVIWDSTTNSSAIHPLGEFVVVVSPIVKAPLTTSDGATSLGNVDVLCYLTNNDICPIDDVVTAVQAAAALSPVRLRNYLKKAKLAAKRRYAD